MISHDTVSALRNAASLPAQPFRRNGHLSDRQMALPAPGVRSEAEGGSPPVASPDYPFCLQGPAVLRCRISSDSIIGRTCEGSIAACSSEGFRLIVHHLDGRRLDDDPRARVSVAFPLQPELTLRAGPVMIIPAGVTANGEATFDLSFRPGASTLKAWCKHLAEHLLRFGQVNSPSQMRRARLPVQRVEPFLRYRLAETVDDYEQVIGLRTTAYAGAGKVSGQTLMTDKFDEGAYIVVGEYFGQIVTSLRVMARDPADEWEQDRFFDWPTEFPPRSDVVEVSRACVALSWQGTDALLGLFKQSLIICLLTGRRWFIGSATPSLLPFYQRLGCLTTTVQFRHSDVGGDPHTVFLGEVPNGLLGRCPPLVWALVWSGTADYAVRTGLLQVPAGSAAVRYRCYRAARPLLAAIGSLMQHGTRVQRSRAKKAIRRSLHLVESHLKGAVASIQLRYRV